MVVLAISRVFFYMSRSQAISVKYCSRKVYLGGLGESFPRQIEDRPTETTSDGAFCRIPLASPKNVSLNSSNVLKTLYWLCFFPSNHEVFTCPYFAANFKELSKLYKLKAQERVERTAVVKKVPPKMMMVRT